MVNGYLKLRPSLAAKLAFTMSANSMIKAITAKTPKPPPMYSRADGSPTLM